MVEACEVIAPSSADAETGFIICADAEANIPPNDVSAEAWFVICAEAAATTVPKVEVPVAFIGNGEPSKPTVTSSNALASNVKRENAIML